MTNTTTAATAALDLDRLEALARAATPGRWMRLFGERTVYDRMEDGCRGNTIVRADTSYSQQDAANLDFIAAANPATVLELIALARAAHPAPAVSEQADELPPLPERPKSMAGRTLDYSEDDMRDYARAALTHGASSAPADMAPAAVAGGLDDVIAWIETDDGLCQAVETAANIKNDGEAFVRLNTVKNLLRATVTSTATPATEKIEAITDELEEAASNYEGDFADTVTGCVEALRALAAQVTPASTRQDADAVAGGQSIRRNDAFINALDAYMDAVTTDERNTDRRVNCRLAIFDAADAWGRAAATSAGDLPAGAPQAQVQRAADGWKMVPLEPTPEQQQAGFDTPGAHAYNAAYRAMVAAAPQPVPAQPGMQARTEPADPDAAAKAVYRLFDGAEAHPWVEGGNSHKQDDARRYAREAIEASAQPVAAAPAFWYNPETVVRTRLTDYADQIEITGFSVKFGHATTPLYAATLAAPVAAAKAAASIKTLSERVAEWKAANATGVIPTQRLMRDEITELRAALDSPRTTPAAPVAQADDAGGKGGAA